MAISSFTHLTKYEQMTTLINLYLHPIKRYRILEIISLNLFHLQNTGAKKEDCVEESYQLHFQFCFLLLLPTACN